MFILLMRGMLFGVNGFLVFINMVLLLLLITILQHFTCRTAHSLPQLPSHQPHILALQSWL